MTAYFLRLGIVGRTLPQLRLWLTPGKNRRMSGTA
jgi:hypothetical protein